MTPAERLRRLIARRRTSQAEIVLASGMSKQQLYRIVSGEVANPGIMTVERIVEAMGATMIDFYEDETI